METFTFDVVMSGGTFPQEQLMWTSAAVALVFLVYGVIARGLFLLTDPVRHSLLEIGDHLFAQPSFPEKDRRLVELALDQVYSPRAARRMAFRTFRIAIGLLLGRVKRQEKPEYPHSYRRNYEAFQLRWTIAVLGNSPVAAFVFCTFLMLFAACTLSATALVRLLIGKNDGDHNNRAVAH